MLKNKKNISYSSFIYNTLVKGSKMGKNKVFKDNKAVAGVIEALLIVALVSIIISTIQLIYIPEIMKQKEYDHMEEVENQVKNYLIL